MRHSKSFSNYRVSFYINNNTTLSAVVEKYGLSHEINIQYVNKSVSKKYSKNITETLKHGLIKLIFEFQLWIFSFIRLSRCNLLVTSDIYNMSHLMGKISQHVEDSFLVYLSTQKNSLKTRLIEMLKGDTFSFISLPIYVPSHEDKIFQEKYDDCVSHIRSWFHDINNTSTIYGVNLNSSLLRYIENELKKKMIDSYGCGDSFAAGLTAGLSANWSLEKAISLASHCGAKCATHLGPYGDEKEQESKVSSNL